MSINRQEIFQGLIFICFIVLIIGFTCGTSVYLYQKRPVTPVTPATISITPGSSFSKISAQLTEAGVIESPLMFKLVAKWTKQTTGLQAGTYLFRDAATPHEVLERLQKGDVLLESLTVPEGFTLKEIAQRVEAADRGLAITFRDLATRPELARELGIPADTLEGYLFPETYHFVPETDERALIRIMVKEFRSRISPELEKRLEEMGWDLHQLVTLASIIQKEAGNDEEMPLISAVFHNRLKRRMRLQADPTVIYGMGDAYAGNIRKKDLLTDTPYNTYTRSGLPAGPIANPGEKALLAAAWPADKKYLYFVARRDGTHQFSRTLIEHNAAVRKYQLRRRR